MNDDELITRHIDPDSLRRGRAGARLANYGVPVWALIGHMGGIEEDPTRTARDYYIPVEAVEAALACYRRFRTYIDARLLLNADIFENINGVER